MELGPSPVHLKTREFAPGSVFVVVVPDPDVIHPDSRLLLQEHLFKLLLSSGKAGFRGPDMEIFCLQILPYKSSFIKEGTCSVLFWESDFSHRRAGWLWQRCVVWIATRSGVKTAVQFELAHLTPHRSFDRGSSRPGSSLFGFGYRSTWPLRHPHCQFSLAASSSAALRSFMVWTWMPAGLRGTTNVNATWIQLQMGPYYLNLFIVNIIEHLWKTMSM